MKPITDYCKHVALFFDQHGAFVGSKSIKFDVSTFEFLEGMYNFKPKRASFFKLVYWLSSTKYYLYTVGIPDPIKLTIPLNYLVNANEYRQVLRTDLIKKLSEVHKTSIFSLLLQPKILIPLLIGGAILYYFLTGGSIT